MALLYFSVSILLCADLLYSFTIVKEGKKAIPLLRSALLCSCFDRASVQGALFRSILLVIIGHL